MGIFSAYDNREMIEACAAIEACEIVTDVMFTELSLFDSFTIEHFGWRKPDFFIPMSDNIGFLTDDLLGQSETPIISENEIYRGHRIA